MALCFVENTGDVTELSTVVERKCKHKTTLKANESEMQSQYKPCNMPLINQMWQSELPQPIPSNYNVYGIRPQMYIPQDTLNEV